MWPILILVRFYLNLVFALWVQTKLIKEWKNYWLMDPARYGFSGTMVFLKHR